MASERLAENCGSPPAARRTNGNATGSRYEHGVARASCGGAALEGTRYIRQNYARSRRERIEQAKEDWKMGRDARPRHGTARSAGASVS